MGEFRDMGIPAQVVKKKSCTSGEAASAGFFFCHACRNSHVPIFAHTGKIFLYESLHKQVVRNFHVPRSGTWKLRLAELVREARQRSQWAGQVSCVACGSIQRACGSSERACVSSPNVKFNNEPQPKRLVHTRHPRHIIAIQKSLCLAKNRSKIPPADQKLLIREDCQSSCCSATVDIMAPMKEWFYAIQFLHMCRNLYSCTCAGIVQHKTIPSQAPRCLL